MGVEVRFIGHSTVSIATPAMRILTDPLLRTRISFLRRLMPPPGPEALPRPDLVLLSHLHQDHTDLPSLRMLGARPLVIAPPGAGDFVAAAGVSRVVEAVLDQPILVPPDVVIRAVPAVHDGGRPPFGPQATAVGYLIEFAGRRVYFAGDTDLFPDMAYLGPVDLALLPVWGWGPNLGPGHMDPAGAAQAAALLSAGAAIPIHWGTYFPLGMRQALLGAARFLTDPPREFASRAAEVAPDTDVLVLEPGDGCDLWQ